MISKAAKDPMIKACRIKKEATYPFVLNLILLMLIKKHIGKVLLN